MNYVGGRYGLRPTDPMIAWKGDAAVARVMDDFTNKCFPPLFQAKDEESKMAAVKTMLEEHGKLMKDVSSNILGSTKFICGDEITIADYAVAGFWINTVLNPNN